MESNQKDINRNDDNNKDVCQIIVQRNKKIRTHTCMSSEFAFLIIFYCLRYKWGWEIQIQQIEK